VADTAFPRGTDVIHGRIKAPLTAASELEGTPQEIEEIVKFNWELLSYRQTAEWGNRGLQGSFGRLRVPLEVNAMDRRCDILEVCARAFCLRTRRMGINQIYSVYVRQENEFGGRDFRNILFADQRRNDRVVQFHIEAVY
jgi:hypothetical protein